MAHNCHGKKNKFILFAVRVFLFAVRLFFRREGFAFGVRFFFCREVISFAVRLLFLPGGNFSFAVR